MYAREEELEQRRRSKLGGGGSGGILYNTQGNPSLLQELKENIFFLDFSCTHGRTCMYASTATRYFTLDSVEKVTFLTPTKV